MQFHNASQHSNCLPELSAPNLSSAVVQGVIPTPSYSPDGCFVPTTQFRTETRTRTVPVTRFVLEKVPERILCPDGRCVTRIKTIKRQVIEYQTQSYTVQVPYSSTLQVVRNQIPVETARDLKLDEILKKLKLILGEELNANDKIVDPVEPPSLKELKKLIEDLDLSETNLKPFAVPRSWTSKPGKHSTIAEAVLLQNNAVRLLKIDGKICDVKLDKLSEADLIYLDQLRMQTSFAELLSSLTAPETYISRLLALGST